MILHLKMHSFRLLRRLLFVVLIVSGILTFASLVNKHLASTVDVVLDAAVSRYIHHISFEELPILERSVDLSLEHRFISLYHVDPPKPNPHVARLLTKCALQPEEETRHLRFNGYPILKIAMDPLKDNSVSENKRNEEQAKAQYFNPAFIPLPPGFNLPPELLKAKGTPTYLLVSRLVTEGLHQESHYCFASISSSGSLGQRMRCLTTPRALNIPPTPANQCTGAWSSFPDIPGFHDPRVFWSGRGEPLIMVNSGSMYGCVGLWMVDLRAVIPELSRALDGDGVQDGSKWRRVPLRIEHLTEITKNPRTSRKEVEKNWVVFFPTRKEAVVVYEAMSEVSIEEELDELTSEHDFQTDLMTESSDPVANDSTSTPVSAFEREYEQLGSAAALNVSLLHSSVLNNTGVFNSLLNEKSGMNISISSTTNHGFDTSTSPDETVHLPGNHQSSLHGNYEPQVSQSQEDIGESSQSRSFRRRREPSIRLSGGRTQALLSSYGYSSPNLTHPAEPPCLDLSSHLFNHDHMGNRGHWHQGSSSLRLVLCTRAQIRDGACLSNTQPSSSSETGHSGSGRNAPDRDKMKINVKLALEEGLIQEGLIVHFSLIHRKFSNDWHLPMRYERYVLVWEARKPWRVIGVSEWPIVFEGEAVRIKSNNESVWREEQQAQGDKMVHASHLLKRSAWNSSSKLFSTERNATHARRHEDEQDEGYHDRAEVQIDEFEQDVDDLHLDTAYFTYSPSIAWVWRREDIFQLAGDGVDDNTQSLGTGYLDDEVLIGIGIDDLRQGFAKVRAQTLLQCLKLCPGVVSAKPEQGDTA